MADMQMSENKQNDMTEEKLLMENQVMGEDSPQMNFDQFEDMPDGKNMEGQFVEVINQQIDNMTDPGSKANSH